jgi:hypothetical protein
MCCFPWNINWQRLAGRWGLHGDGCCCLLPLPLMIWAAAGAVLCCGGQVHLATLKTGEKVVVKVQRPGLKELFDIDLKNIR